MRHGLTETGFGLTQKQILAAADALWLSGVVRPDVEPTAVMVAVASMLKAAYRERPHTESLERDAEEQIRRRLGRA